MKWGATVMVPCSPDDPDATLIRANGSVVDFPGEPEEDREPQPHGGASKRTRRTTPADVIAMKAHTPMALIPSSKLSKVMRGAVAEKQTKWVLKREQERSRQAEANRQAAQKARADVARLIAEKEELTTELERLTDEAEDDPRGRDHALGADSLRRLDRIR